MSALRALAIASEMAPFVKTGGLADVVGALPYALAAENIELRTLIPGYPDVIATLRAGETVLAVRRSLRRSGLDSRGAA